MKKRQKKSINVYIRVTSRANWAAKLKILTGELVSASGSFPSNASVVNKFSKVVIACRAENKETIQNMRYFYQR